MHNAVISIGASRSLPARSIIFRVKPSPSMRYQVQVVGDEQNAVVRGDPGQRNEAHHARHRQRLSRDPPASATAPMAAMGRAASTCKLQIERMEERVQRQQHAG